MAVLACAPSAQANRGSGPIMADSWHLFEDEDPSKTTGLELGADLEVSGALGMGIRKDKDADGGGIGAKLRLGETFRSSWLRVTPEVGYGFTHLSIQEDSGDPSHAWNMHRAFAGARFAFGSVLVPVVYGHVGYGWRAASDPLVPEGSGFAYDVGVALDVHLKPPFGFGVYGEVAGIDAQPYTPRWASGGVHAEVVF